VEVNGNAAPRNLALTVPPAVAGQTASAPLEQLVGALPVTALDPSQGGMTAGEYLYIYVVGTVRSANVTAGPWVGVQAGDPAWFWYAVPPTGFVIDPGRAESYEILWPSLWMVVNDIGLGLRQGPVRPSMFLTNNYPVADALVLGPDFIPLEAPGHGIVFELHDSTGTAWSSPTLADILGFYFPAQFDDVEWAVPTPGGGMVFQMDYLAPYSYP
jgi:hypothetical protein